MTIYWSGIAIDMAFGFRYAANIAYRNQDLVWC
jgi:hypothetical protein